LPEPINFQPDRNRTLAPAGRRHCSDGNRNNCLRHVMCGRWIHGFATDRGGMFEQMREIRATRCAPGDDMGATDARMWHMVRDTARRCPCGESCGQGGCGVKRCTQDRRFAAIDLSMINVLNKDAGYA